MKKVILALIFALVMANPSFAGRYDNYLSVKAGYSSGKSNHLGDDTFNGIGGTFALGQNYKSNEWLYFRGEAEFGYTTMSHDSVTVSPLGLMANFYADFGTQNWFLRPYVGAGFGAKYISVSHGDSGIGIAWNGQGGVSFNFTEELNLDAGFRYDVVSTPDFTFHGPGVFAGVRWNFN